MTLAAVTVGELMAQALSPWHITRFVLIPKGQISDKHAAGSRLNRQAGCLPYGVAQGITYNEI
jgi:hypothetical protein